jgi:flagellar biogenesis protein FliO
MLGEAPYGLSKGADSRESQHQATSAETMEKYILLMLSLILVLFAPGVAALQAGDVLAIIVCILIGLFAIFVFLGWLARRSGSA